MFREILIRTVWIFLTGAILCVTGCGPSPLPVESIVHELPIVTHWSNTQQSFEYLAADGIDFSVPYPEGDYVPGDCYPRYRMGTDFYPGLDQYVGTNFSTTQVPDEDVEKFAEEVRTETGVGIKFLRPDAFEAGRLVSEPGFVQVLHGRVVRSTEDDPGSLATIFLPLNWSENAGPGTYPIVANGMYDLNYQVFYRVAHAMGGRLLAPFIANSGVAPRTGAIGVLWNGGGAEATFTLNERSFHQFAAVIDFVAENLGGDRERILMGGNSRGGSTTVTLASNPLDLNYTVTFAAASSALAVWGSGPQLASPTYAKQLNNLARVTGLRDAWRSGWRYPEGANPQLAGLTAHAATARILTGRSDVAEIDSTWSPSAPGFVNRLKEEQTQLYLEISGHDTIPFVKQLEYARTLEAAAIPVHVDVLVRRGHTPRYVTAIRERHPVAKDTPSLKGRGTIWGLSED